MKEKIHLKLFYSQDRKPKYNTSLKMELKSNIKALFYTILSFEEKSQNFISSMQLFNDYIGNHWAITVIKG